MTEREIYERAIDVFGTRSQLLKCAEECNELSKEIIKYVSGSGGTGRIEEEAADVEITLKQLKLMLNISRFNDHKKIKLKRLKGLIKDTYKGRW